MVDSKLKVIYCRGMMDLGQERGRCLSRLVWAAHQLQVDVNVVELARVAELIVQTMTGPWRCFHVTNHAFEVGGSEDAIEVLAALFHDLIYVQVDRGLNVNLSLYIAPFIKEVRGQLFIRPKNDLTDDKIFRLVAAVFGFEPGQALLPLSGQNEFLSALVAAKLLEPFFLPATLAQIAVCIEATIPFRSKKASGMSSCNILYKRLLKCNFKFSLGLTELEIQQTVKRAVRLANRDLRNFSEQSSARFLDNTWQLLPEANHHLKRPNSYSVREYRIALQKMESFISVLDPESVFQQFREEPDEQSYRDLIDRAQKNINVARLYLGTKLVAIAILEALSLRLGKDIPISTMLGELPSVAFSSPRFEDFLPVVTAPYQSRNELECEVIDLLEKGRSRDFSYDLKNSPLTSFIVRSLGFVEVESQLKLAKMFFQGAISAEDFLATCNADIMRTITNGVLQIFESRKIALCRA